MQRFTRRLLAGLSLSTALTFGSSAQAALIVDQSVTRWTASGGLTTAPTVQSFTPNATNLAGVDVLIIGTAVLTTDVSISIYRAFEHSSGQLSDLLVSTIVPDHPRGTAAEARWSPLTITPGELLYLAVDAGDLAVGVLQNGNYSGGEIVLIGSSVQNNFAFDVTFRSYSDDAFVAAVPVAGSLPLLALGLLLLRRRA